VKQVGVVSLIANFTGLHATEVNQETFDDHEGSICLSVMFTVDIVNMYAVHYHLKQNLMIKKKQKNMYWYMIV